MNKGIEPIKAQVLDIFEVTEGIYELELQAPAVVEQARPGQFAMLRPGNGGKPYLARPMGIYDVNPKRSSISILFEVHGAGTQAMAQMQPGNAVDLLAPLGNGFTVAEDTRRALVIGGGIGVAPLYPLLCQLRRQDVETEIMLGAQCGERMLGLERLVPLGMVTRLYTDNGTMGKQGYPTDDLPEVLRYGRFDQVFCCGPMPLMRGVARICGDYRTPCQVSLEERMGCGFGICVCCVVDVRDAEGNIAKKRVCYDGPVFDGQEVVW